MDTEVQALPECNYAGECPKARSLLEEIFSKTSNTTKRRQLINLWTVLERQARANSDDYQIVTIGKQTTDLGGPTTQTLRNANGNDYRSIIAVFVEEIGAAGKPPKKASSDPIEDMINGISDRTLRHQVRLLIQENRSLRNEVNLLKRTLTNSAPPIPVIGSATTRRTELPTASLTPSMIEAVSDFIKRVDEGTKYRENEFGAVVDANFDEEIAAPGFLQGLKILLARAKAT